MSKHRHTIVLAREYGRDWFVCERCSARVEVVPTYQGNKVTCSLRVRDPGVHGFSVDELGSLCRLWLANFVAFVNAQSVPARPGRKRRRRVKMSELRVLGVWSDPSGIDRSAV